MVEAGASGSVGHARAEVGLVNEEGLHARPAAEFARCAAGFEATITVNGVDAKSLLRILALGLPCGSRLVLEAEGADADGAIAALVALVENGFAA